MIDDQMKDEHTPVLHVLIFSIRLSRPPLSKLLVRLWSVAIR